MATPVPLIAVRGSSGLRLVNGHPLNSQHERFQRDESKQCRASCWSPDGRFLAWVNGQSLNVWSSESGEVCGSVNKPQIRSLEFSPKSAYLCTWETYSVPKGATQGPPNLHVYGARALEAVHSCVRKRQDDWNHRWTDDEKLCARLVNSDVYVHECPNFETAAAKTKGLKVASFSVSRGPAPYHVTCYVPGSAKGQPSSVKLFRYPRLDGAPVGNKSFFRADGVEFKWNAKGTAVLIVTSTEVDKTGASYYGEKGLHLMTVNGDGCIVQPPKEGPVYSVEWSPNCVEFCAVHGFMPAKATLFNMKADPVFDFGTGPRNACYYNCHGNLLILAGFGNLRGNMEVWDAKKRRQVSKTQASDTTFLEWAPDGQHVLTAVTAPRLRVGNAYRVWHYTGALVHEALCADGGGDELWQVGWQPLPESLFPERPVSYVPVEGIESARPEVSKEVYRPPGARGQPSSFDVHADDEGVSLIRPPSQAVTGEDRVDKKKKKKSKKPSRSDVPSWKEKPAVLEADEKRNDAEEKLTKSQLHKKLRQIQKLKEERDAGRELQPTQIAKIDRENEILDLLNNVKV